MEFYAQQQLEERRRQEDEAIDAERERYHEAHPEDETCPNHPNRLTVDRHSFAGRWCSECIEVRKTAYADYRPLDAWRGKPEYDMPYYRDEYNEDGKRK